MTQDALKVGVLYLTQLEEKVLDVHIVVRPCQAQAGGRFQGVPAGIVQFADQRLQADAHATPLSFSPLPAPDEAS